MKVKEVSDKLIKNYSEYPFTDVEINEYDFSEDWSWYTDTEGKLSNQQQTWYDEYIGPTGQGRYDDYRNNKHVPDPDSESLLLNKIYEKLWDREVLDLCRDKNKKRKGEVVIKGDTLNSCQTTLSELKKPDDVIPEDVKPETEIFMDSYHTLGNFMPIPLGCNAPRGIGLLKDYWDLALLCIYLYYMSNEDGEKRDVHHIERIVGKERTKDYKKWLDCFRNWGAFVEENYMDSFVEKDSKPYGKPLELWEGHFDKFKSVLPETKEECKQYFKNAAERIKKRGELMAEKLKEKMGEDE